MNKSLFFSDSFVQHQYMPESSVATITRDSANSMLTLQLRLRLEV